MKYMSLQTVSNCYIGGRMKYKQARWLSLLHTHQSNSQIQKAQNWMMLVKRNLVHLKKA